MKVYFILESVAEEGDFFDFNDKEFDGAETNSCI